MMRHFVTRAHTRTHTHTPQTLTHVHSNTDAQEHIHTHTENALSLSSSYPSLSVSLSSCLCNSQLPPLLSYSAITRSGVLCMVTEVQKWAALLTPPQYHRQGKGRRIDKDEAEGVKKRGEKSIRNKKGREERRGEEGEKNKSYRISFYIVFVRRRARCIVRRGLCNPCCNKIASPTWPRTRQAALDENMTL